MQAAEPAASDDAAAADDPAQSIPPTDDPSRWYVMWGLTPPDVPSRDPARPPIVTPDNIGVTRDGSSEPPPPPEAAITASDGGPSWLTRPRAGWQIRATTRPHSEEPAADISEAIADFTARLPESR